MRVANDHTTLTAISNATAQVSAFAEEARRSAATGCDA